MKQLSIFLFFKSFLKKFYGRIIILINIMLIIFLDLYSKYAIKMMFSKKCDAWLLKAYKFNLYYKCKIHIFSFLKFSYVENHGMVFGIMSGYKYTKYFIPLLVLIPIFFVCQMMHSVYKDKSLHIMHKKFQIFCLSMILGGGLGNMIDRIANGFVFDFIDVYYKQYHWYTFNVADCFVCTGIFALISFDILNAIKNKRKRK